MHTLKRIIYNYDPSSGIVEIVVVYIGPLDEPSS